MIVNFSIQNFGSIKDKQTLSFEADASKHLEDTYVVHTAGKRLLKLALIYGANASGKTTILKALDFLGELVLNPKNKKIEELEFEPFLFNSETYKQPSELSIEFIQQETRYLYEITFTKKGINKEVLYKFSHRKTLLFKRETNLERQLTNISFQKEFSISKNAKETLQNNTLSNNTVFGGFLKTNIDIEELRHAINWFIYCFKPIIYTKTQLEGFITREIERGYLKKEDIVKILKKADFHISDIILEKEEKSIPSELINLLKNELEDERFEVKKSIISTKIIFEHSVNNNLYALPFQLESEGTKRFYGFAGILALLIKTPTIFPIDELESSLHPDLYTHFLLSFLQNTQHSQLIATTHNRELLGDKENFRNDVIWFTNKDEDCATELYSLADFDTSAIKNFLNAYKIGKFSGVPRLFDTFIDLEQ
ncbi:ATP-binding protein [uncultured Capnocytophaga sp.]|uniref:AAA family ATPase n=1 Tax=uncultured Capnocytophaga sp. TaxID=159273 RepID=UPI00262C23AC|nr:ATP-binding protein [uncultured Capnocytophaga sp.]